MFVGCEHSIDFDGTQAPPQLLSAAAGAVDTDSRQTAAGMSRGGYLTSIITITHEITPFRARLVHFEASSSSGQLNFLEESSLATIC